jgi:hypothetical protein
MQDDPQRSYILPNASVCNARPVAALMVKRMQFVIGALVVAVGSAGLSGLQ